MSKIAKKFGLTNDQILAANKQIKNPNKIAVGDEITIPVAALAGVLVAGWFLVLAHEKAHDRQGHARARGRANGRFVTEEDNMSIFGKLVSAIFGSSQTAGPAPTVCTRHLR